MTDIAPVTHGVTDGAAEVGEFRLTETSHVPNARIGRHRHAYPAVTFVLRGGFTEDFGGSRSHDCGAMSVLCKPADAIHSNRYSRLGARSFILEYTGESPDRPALDRGAPRFGPSRLVMPMLELYTAFRTGAPERVVMAEEIVLEISRDQRTRLDWRMTRRPRWLPAVADAAADRCTQALGLTRLASEVGVHPVYLARVFRRHYGQSLGSFLLQCRVRLAMRRLATDRDPIARIAVDCGFADQAHFTRVFRREVGMPPARFRRVSRMETGAA